MMWHLKLKLKGILVVIEWPFDIFWASTEYIVIC